MIIAIDGPAASGKSTLARALAKKLNFVYIDSGAMYRIITWQWLKITQGLKSDKDVDILDELLKNCKIDFVNGDIVLNASKIGQEIRTNNVSNFVSYISGFQNVRKALTQIQRQIAFHHNVVMDGRDIGTIVFPQADLKLYLSASPELRASRRRQDLGKDSPDLESLIKQIKARDLADSTRVIAPLCKAEDAIEIFSDNSSVEELLDFVIKKVQDLDPDLVV